MRKVREREFEPYPDFFPPVAKDLCEKLLVRPPLFPPGNEAGVLFSGLCCDSLFNTCVCVCVLSQVSEPDERLGSNGFDEIKSHPFFEGIDWEAIVTATPPPLASNPNVPKPTETTRRASSSSLPNLDEVPAHTHTHTHQRTRHTHQRTRP